MTRKGDSKRVGAGWWVIDRRRSPRARGRGWMTAALSTSMALGVLGAQACRDGEPDPELAEQSAVTISTVELGRIGGRIYNEPDRAGGILGEAGLDPVEFERRVREVTNDPALAREYTRGFEVVARVALPDDTVAIDSSAASTPPALSSPPGPYVPQP